MAASHPCLASDFWLQNLLVLQHHLVTEKSPVWTSAGSLLPMSCVNCVTLSGILYLSELSAHL